MKPLSGRRAVALAWYAFDRALLARAPESTRVSSGA